MDKPVTSIIFKFGDATVQSPSISLSISTDPSRQQTIENLIIIFDADNSKNYPTVWCVLHHSTPLATSNPTSPIGNKEIPENNTQ
jgi:hypothetical protein